MSLQSAALQFERLIAQILRTEGHQVTENVRFKETGVVIDIVASRRDAVTPIEVKLGPGGRAAGLSLLRKWGSQTAFLQKFATQAKPVLAIGTTINRDHRAWAEAEFGIQIWDAEDLLERAGALRDELKTVLDRPASPNGPFGVPFEEAERKLRALGYIVDPEPTAEPDKAPAVGEILISRLQSTQTGRNHAKAYEEICRDIIAYVFERDLLDGRSQKRTTDDVNVYDLIYRVAPHNAFWSTLTRDFRARVVMFECKNYTHPIKAMQIFTTERYLSTNVLRPVCFILTRKAPHRNAVQAAFGAMRDSQKLLVVLSDEDLVAMIKARDAQLALGGTAADRLENDPTEILDQRIYDFIAGIPR